MPGGRPKGSKNKRGPYSPSVLEHIKTVKIINWMQKQIFGDEKTDMAKAKLAATLLSKKVPSLQSVDMSHEGEIGTYAVTDRAVSAEEWERAAQANLGTSAGTAEATH